MPRLVTCPSSTFEPNERKINVNWKHYLAAVAVGFFLGNAVSHLVAGVTDQMFPSPFGDPPSIGLSSPFVNAVWGLANIAIGYVFFRISKAHASHTWLMIAFFLGFAGVTLFSSVHFEAAFGNSGL